MADAFVNYLYDNYRGARHVRRVAAWFGLIVMGIAKVKEEWRIPSSRQLMFDTKGRRYKVKYNHRLKPRGGIEIVEISKDRRPTEIGRVASFTNLLEAAKFYDKPTLRRAAHTN